MKNITKALLCILLAMPLPALANGEEVLVTLGIQALTILVFLIALFFIDLTLKGKAILATVYTLTILIIFYLTEDVSAYRENMNMLNAFVAVVPALVFFIMYRLLKPKFKKS